jgi:hypothetical protein
MATTDELEGRIAALEARFPKSMAGPIANSLNVAQIGYSPTAASSMFLNMIGNQPGAAPRLSVTDANKVVRAEIGNLAANGISPAQFGFRANNASGTPIFDSLGLIGVANLLVEENPTPSTTAGSGSNWSVIQTIPNSGANFTLPRQGNILCLSVVSVDPTAGALNYTALYHGIWTQGGAFVSRKIIGAAQYDQGVDHFLTGITVFTGLAAGNYQFRQEFALDAGTTSVTFGGGATGVGPRADVIQLGN